MGIIKENINDFISAYQNILISHGNPNWTRMIQIGKILNNFFIKNFMTIKTELEKIAKEYFLVETLATRNMDSLDFHEISVWAIKGALEEAYKLGQQNKYFKDT